MGPANGNWSTAANWNAAQVPGNNDTVFFDAAPLGANTNSNMDLGGGATYHIAGLQITAGYTSTITITSNLWVDVFNMSGGTISGTKDLVLTQVTTNTMPATNFGTSYFKGGKINTNLWTFGEAAHQLTLTLAGPGNSPDLEAIPFNWRS